MPQNEDSLRDPVCGMTVDAGENAIEYQQMHFAFCSTQCKERFLANPHLYIGQPGYKSPAQEGRVIMKHRRLQLEEALTTEQARHVTECVQAMMGIKSISITDDLIEITYDLMQLTELQIESKLAGSGAVLGHGLSERLRHAFVHYLEETELASLEVQPGTSGHHH